MKQEELNGPFEIGKNLEQRVTLQFQDEPTQRTITHLLSIAEIYFGDYVTAKKPDAQIAAVIKR